MKLVYAIISAVAISPTLLSAAVYSCAASDNDIGYYESNSPYSSYQGNYYPGNQPYYEKQSYSGRYNQSFGDTYNYGQQPQGYNSAPFGGQYNQNTRSGSQGRQYYRDNNNYQRDNQGYYDPATGNSTPPTQNSLARDTFKTPEDRELIKRIRQELAQKRDLNQGRVTIIVVDKKIQLQGQVGSKDDASKIEESITAIEGVDSVDNQLDYPNKSSSWWNFGSKSNQPSDKDNDHVLLERIQEVVEGDRDANNFQAVEINVDKNIVILRGSVDNEQIRKNLRNKIQQVKGVNQVNDQMTVNSNRGNELAFGNTTSHSTANVSDGTIKSNIENKLRPGFFSKGFEQVEVIVNNGEVIVKGVVDSQDDIKTLTDRIQAVDGVQSVDNQAIVRKISK